MNSFKFVLGRKYANFYFETQRFIFKTSLCVALALFSIPNYSQSKKASASQKTAFTNPVENSTFSDLVSTCQDDGVKLPKMFLCGSEASRTITTSISATSISWERLDAGSCSAISNQDCPNKATNCTWVQKGTGQTFVANEDGQFRIKIVGNDNIETIFYFNVYKNDLDIPVEKTDIYCGNPGKIVVAKLTGYEYSLDGTIFQDSNEFQITSPNSYKVTVRRKGSGISDCKFEIPVEISSKVLEVEEEITQPKCYNNKGDLKLTAKNVRGQYYYKLLKGSLTINSGTVPSSNSSITISGLNSGNYTWEVTTDDCKVPVKEDFSITVPSELQLSPYVKPSTANSKGAITLTASNGTPPYTYFFNSNPITANPIVNLENDINYVVSVVDKNGCNVEKTIQISSQPKPVYKLTTTNAKCYNEASGNITFTVSDSKGNNKIEFSIDNGATYLIGSTGTNGEITSSFANLTAGTYNTVIRYTYDSDPKAISEIKQDVIISQPSVALTASAGVSELSGCGVAPNQLQGKLRITNPQGGTSPYTFSFDNQKSFSTIPEAYLDPGTYTFYVKDKEGCIFTTPSVTLDKVIVPTFKVENTKFNCDGTATSEVKITSSNSTDFSYTYSLDGKTPQNSASFTNVTAGEHTLTLNYTPIKVPDYSNLLKEDFGFGDATRSKAMDDSGYTFENQTPPNCVGECFIGNKEYSVTPQIKGIRPEGAWFDLKDHSDPTKPKGRFLVVNINGDSSNPILYEKTINDIIPNQPIKVEFYVFNLIKKELSGHAPPNLSIGLVNSEGVEIARFNTGFIPQNISWNLFQTELNPGNNTTLRFTVRSIQTEGKGNDVAIDDISAYQIPKACSAAFTSTFLVPSDKKFTAEILSQNNVSCSGLSDGKIQIKVANFDPVKGFEYSINDGVNWKPATTSPFNITDLAKGNYKLKIRPDATSSETCLQPKPLITTLISEPAPFETKVSATDANCISGGEIKAESTGGTKAYKYELWNETDTVKIDSQNSGVFQNVVPGNYTIRSSDANKCKTASTLKITVKAPSEVKAEVDLKESNVCYDSVNKAKLVVKTTSGKAPFSFQLNTQQAITTSTFTDLVPGNYTITVIDANSCKTELQTIKIGTELKATATLSRPLNCTSSPNALIKVAVEGGVKPLRYVIKKGTSIVVPSTTIPDTDTSFEHTVLPTETGTYTFEITDANGCTNTTSAVVVSPKFNPEISLSQGKTILCKGDATAEIKVVLDNTKGVSPFVYSVKNTTSNVVFGDKLSGLPAGSYTVTVTDANSCTDTKTIQIDEPLALSVKTKVDPITCSGLTNGISSGKIFVENVGGGVSPFDYQVSGPNAYSRLKTNNNGNTPISFDDVKDFGIYTVTVIDKNGCQVSDSNVIIASPPDILGIDTNFVVNCSVGGNAIIKVNSTTNYTSNGPFQFSLYKGVVPNFTTATAALWKPEDATNSRQTTFTGLIADVKYTFVVFDETTKCYIYKTADNAIPTNSTLEISNTVGNNITCKGSADGKVSFTVKNNYTIDMPISFQIYDALSLEPIGSEGAETLLANSSKAITDFGNLPVGNYIVIVKENAGSNVGCTKASERFTIKESLFDFNKPEFTLKKANCNQNGQIQVQASGGTPSYFYQVQNSSGSSPIIPPPPSTPTGVFETSDSFAVPEGNFTVFVKDSFGCIKSDEGTMSKDPSPEISLAVTNECVKEGQFEIKVNKITDGISPYSMSINGGAWSSTTLPFTLSNKNSGNYSISIKDINGCVDTETKLIATPLDLEAVVTKLPSCDENDGEIEVKGYGGSGNFQFKIDSGSFSTNTIYTALSAGYHTVEIKDLTTNCIQSKSITLEAPTPIKGLAFTKKEVSCNGGNDGSITVSIAATATSINDNPIYMYSLNGGTPQESNVFTGLTAGTYSIEVVSARGCEDSKTNIKIEEPSKIVVNAPTVSQFLCNVSNEFNNAFIEANVVNGGSGNFVQFEYFKNGNLVQFGSDIKYIETDKQGGNYTLNVYDTNGCVGTFTPIKINPFIGLATLDVAITKPISCNAGENIKASTTTIGGNPSSTEFKISAISGSLKGTTIANDNSGNFTNLAIGEYLITFVNKDTGCVIDYIHKVNDPNTFDLTIQVENNVSCLGDSNGSATVSFVDLNATNRAGSFSFKVIDSFNTVVFSGNSANAGPTKISNLKSGIYKVEASLLQDPFCSVTKSFTITQPSERLELNFTQTPITCVIGNNDGTINASAKGGWSDRYEYKLERGTTIISDWLNVTDFKQLTAGSYTISTRDANGCVAAKNVVLNNPKTISLIASSTKTLLDCFGDTTGSIIVTNVSGGQGSNYTYALEQLSPISQKINPQINNEFKNLGAGSYIVTVSDTWSCTSKSNIIQLNEPKEIIPSISINSVQTCSNQVDLRLTVVGGTPPYSFSTDGITYSTDIFNPSITRKVGLGNHVFKIKDKNNCISKDSNKIVINPLESLTASINMTNAKVNCKGDTTAIVSASAKGGVGNYTYSLLDSTSNTVVRPSQTSGSFSSLGAGKYKLKVTSGDCIDFISSEIEVTEPKQKLTSKYIVSDILCAGSNDGLIEVNTSGGTVIIKQSISPNLNQFVESTKFENLTAGNYEVIIQDALGCFEKTTHTISEPDLINASVITSSIIEEICEGDANASFEISISGGKMPYKVAIDNPTGTYVDGTASQNQFSFSGLNGGNHSVFVVDANNCMTQEFIFLKQAIKLNPTTITNYQCVNNLRNNSVTVNLDSSITDLSLVQFALDGGIYQNSNVFTNVASGTHFIRVKHSNGCIKDTPTFSITSYAPLSLSLKNEELNTIEAIATGGSGNYKFTFNNESKGSVNTFEYFQSQNYTVTVEDSNGCKVSLTQKFEYIDICIPNHFTPNGDGINDFWSPGCVLNYKDLIFSVYDRYGRQIQIFNYGESWDGKYQGNELPSGDYWYILKLNNSNDNREFVGHFTLYR